MDQVARFSGQERIEIVEAYFETKSVVQTQREFQRVFPGRNAPGFSTKQMDKTHIKTLLDKFRETGSLQDNTGRSVRPQSVRTENCIMTVRQCLEQSPSKSVRRFSQDTGLSRSPVMRIME